MRHRNRIALPLVVLSLLALAFQLPSCGGGGGSSAPATGVTRGAITGFGSIWVNGVEIRTDNTTVRTHPDDNNLDIESPDDVAFRPGMVVTVKYRTSDNMATSVIYRNELSGPIDAIDPVARTFTVLGFTIHEDNTYYDGLAAGATLDNLAVGNVVEVSGLPDNVGVVQATYVDFQAAAAQAGEIFEVKGYVNSLDPVAKTFTLTLVPGGAGGVAVNYAGATDVSVGLANNDFVEVKVTATAAPLAATAVEKVNDLSDDSVGATKVSVSGFVSGLAGDATAGYTFFIGGQSVRVAPGTTGIGLVVAGAKLDVEGPIDAAGVLQAVKVEPEL
jgi:hypothetical protein